MTTFDEREQAFERKFVHDAELEFRAESARNMRLAFWAAQLMGKTASEAAAYAREVIRADFHEPGGSGVLKKVSQDLGDLSDETTIRQRMDDLLAAARTEIIGLES